MDGTARCDKKCDLADRYNLENAEILCGLILDTIERLLSPSSDGELDVVFPARYWPKLSKEGMKQYVKQEADWNKRYEKAKAHVRDNGEYPRPATDKSLYDWLRRYLPGNQHHTLMSGTS